MTALVPALGYEACSDLAPEALETDRDVYGLVLEKGLMTKESLEELLKPENMTGSKSPHPPFRGFQRGNSKPR